MLLFTTEKCLLIFKTILLNFSNTCITSMTCLFLLESESEQEEESGSDEEDIQSLSEEDAEQASNKAATKERQYAYPSGTVKR